MRTPRPPSTNKKLTKMMVLLEVGSLSFIKSCYLLDLEESNSCCTISGERVYRNVGSIRGRVRLGHMPALAEKGVPFELSQVV